MNVNKDLNSVLSSFNAKYGGINKIPDDVFITILTHDLDDKELAKLAEVSKKTHELVEQARNDRYKECRESTILSRFVDSTKQFCGSNTGRALYEIVQSVIRESPDRDAVLKKYPHLSSGDIARLEEITKYNNDCNLIAFFSKIVEKNPENTLFANFFLTIKNLSIEKQASKINEFFEDPKNQKIIQKIKVLDLSQGNIRRLPEAIKYFTGLETLKLRDNGLTDISPDIGALVNLKILELDNNNLTSLPETLFNLSKLETLRLSNNKLQFLPDEIRNLYRLKTLEILSNKLSSLPDGLTKLSSLVTLSISHNRVELLPPNMTDLSNLKHFYTSNNHLKSLEFDFIHRLMNMTTVDIEHNKLTDIPVDLAQKSRRAASW